MSPLPRGERRDSGRILLFLVMALVLVLDQSTKFLVMREFGLYESRQVIPGLFSLTYLTNTGAAFGILAGQPTRWRQAFFVGVGLLALGVILWVRGRMAARNPWYTVSLGLIGGGALGNLVDRVRFGAVVDFLDFYIGSHHWPPFNVADSAICVGVALFLALQFFGDNQQQDIQGS